MLFGVESHMQAPFFEGLYRLLKGYRMVLYLWRGPALVSIKSTGRKIRLLLNPNNLVMRISQHAARYQKR